MPNPLLFVGKGAALTAAARAADKANEGGGAFQRLGEGRGAAIRLAWPAEALHTRERRAAGELRAVQHQERAEAPREAERAAAEERTAEQAALLAPLAATDTTARLAKRRRSALVELIFHDDFQTEMERLDEDGGDADMRSNFANGMRDGYPCQQLTLVFLQYLLTSRIRQSHSSRRQGCELVGRGAKTVGVQFNIMRSHAAASALQVAVGANATTAAAAGDAASQAVQLAMRAATAPSLTRQHLGQTGQYILQDALLSEWVEVNEAFVLNAYVTLARQTGCRPGMVVNVGHDSVDQNGAWAHCAPLVWQDLLVGKLEEGLELPHGGGLAWFYFELIYQRAKGQYFSNVQYGTCVTPDSDEMIRLGTVTLQRLMVRTAAAKAVYANLTHAEVAYPT
ncbi:hypothetical protein EMIHUDRAFT_230488 [Emiliania huxleyi CCMP1516]|uniref:Uncharacterized protein n=2 Tax=Emiliania huxleyi TaxID=2903 RepID=A0A0D3KAB8_EMIH1|nr:hypothetical protein EMIHUDRAFT_230488 [Emiliania huxleyi CCMP1516]EOD32703.1 hypothetical protein EMIHUDRAFT_230488 [Emiliania huxleyi CCMP1516]|eukprot:XP_005785132.1 hypothetical protein EMIHUDRAFT_230488 [Emiliania huxleyi CCMP1516]